MEHLNKLLKSALKQFGANVTEAGAQRIARGLTGLERLISNVDSDCNLNDKSGYHSARHLREPVLLITQDLFDEKVFDFQPGRSYQCLGTNVLSTTRKLVFLRQNLLIAVKNLS